MSISPALNAKIKAMTGELLSPEQIMNLENMSGLDIEREIKRLKPNLNWPKNQAKTSAKELEKVLLNSVIDDFLKIYYFADIKLRPVIAIYGLQFEIRFIKHALKAIEQKGQTDVTVGPLANYLETSRHYHLNEIILATNFNAFIEALRDTPFAKFFSQHEKYFSDDSYEQFIIESDLDKFRAKLTVQEVKNLLPLDLAKDLNRYYGMKYDLINLNTIYRLKFLFKVTNEEIEAHLFKPGRKLTSEVRLNLLASTSPEAYQRKVEELGYESVLNYAKESFSVYQQEQFISKQLRRFAKQFPNSVLNIFAFFNQKELEVRHFIHLIEQTLVKPKQH